MKIFLFLFVFVLFCIQGILFGYDYFDNPSSACLDCSVFEETLGYSFVTSLLFVLVFIVIEKLLQNAKWSQVLYMLLFVLNMLFIDTMLFENRVSSWSTYTFLETILSVLYKSTPLLIVFALLFFTYYKIIYASQIKQKLVKETSINYVLNNKKNYFC